MKTISVLRHEINVYIAEYSTIHTKLELSLCDFKRRIQERTDDLKAHMIIYQLTIEISCAGDVILQVQWQI